MDITGTSALVTGGASGLGLATTEALVKAGALVTILDLARSPGEAIAARYADQVQFVAGDVRSEGDVQRAVDAVSAQGELRCLIQCAGVATPGKLVGRDGPIALETLQRVLDINVLGTMNVMRIAAARMQALEPMADGERGVIINTASVAAFDGQIGQVAYAASKAAIAGMTLPVARELASSQIRVVAIAPGIFDTPMLAGLPEAARESLGQQVPHPSRLGKPSEYALLVTQILANPMLNGDTIRLDGAIRMAPR